MPLLTIQSANEYVPVGVYPGKFSAIEEIENEHGNAYRWKFALDNGKTMVGISDRNKPPTEKNKTGRWLAALASKGLSEGLAVNTEEFIGKKYMVVVTDNGNNRTKLETFSRVPE